MHVCPNIVELCLLPVLLPARGHCVMVAQMVDSSIPARFLKYCDVRVK